VRAYADDVGGSLVNDDSIKELFNEFDRNGISSSNVKEIFNKIDFNLT
jgi:hypothetical protein